MLSAEGINYKNIIVLESNLIRTYSSLKTPPPTFLNFFFFENS